MEAKAARGWHEVSYNFLGFAGLSELADSLISWLEASNDSLAAANQNLLSKHSFPTTNCLFNIPKMRYSTLKLEGLAI